MGLDNSPSAFTSLAPAAFRGVGSVQQGLSGIAPAPMSLLQFVQSWWAAHRPKKLDELLAIEFDADEVRVIVLARLEKDWNQSFRWSDVERVCFKDEGLSSSDILFIEIKDKKKPVAVLTEARGSTKFFGALTERGLFPEDVWRKAMGETGGALHCWPPKKNDR